MQIASIMLALAGDTGNTVPKYNVTPSEVAVLQLIHGDDAVTDINVTGDVKRSSRDERQRLIETYGRQQDGRWQSGAIDALFPGVAARLFENFDEMGLDESLFAAKERAAPKKADPLDHDEDGRRGGSKPAEPTVDLDTMTKEQLIEYAKANNIEVDASAKKADVLAAIQREEEARANTDPADEDDGIGDINDGVGRQDDNLFK